jgi:hypothetical protein
MIIRDATNSQGGTMPKTPTVSITETIHRWLGFLVIGCALTACSGGSDESQPNPTSGSSADRGTSGRIIDNEDLSPGLQGEDANRNGIRDDIDRLIAQRYAQTTEVRRAAEQKARALQRSLEATTREQALRAGDAIKRAAWCTAQVISLDSPTQIQFWENMSKDIEALTANTQERFRAYWETQQLMSGATFRQPDGNACE